MDELHYELKLNWVREPCGKAHSRVYKALDKVHHASQSKFCYSVLGTALSPSLK